MHFYSLSTLTLTVAALLANQQVSAAAAGNQEACIKTAYAIYNTFTQEGCNVNGNTTACLAKMDFFIKNLNIDLDKCGRSDYVTLCRIIPAPFFSFSTCTSLREDGKLTKEACEAQRRIDYVYNGGGGSKQEFDFAMLLFNEADDIKKLSFLTNAMPLHERDV
ncbi:hypothetical protein MBANPS3_003032 [Mucor bainieri]